MRRARRPRLREQDRDNDGAEEPHRGKLGEDSQAARPASPAASARVQVQINQRT